MKIEIGKTIQTIVVCLLLIGVATAVSEFGNNIVIPGNATFAGNVGIGTATPAYKLTIEKSTTTSPIVHIINTGASGVGILRIETNANDKSELQLYTNGNRNWGVGAGQTIAGTFEIRDITDSAPRISISPSGNVGIGNNSPSNILAFAIASSTDPIADSWLTYSTSDTKQVLYEADVDFVKATNELRNAKIYAWQRTPTEPIRYGVMANDLTTPESIIAYHDGKKNTNKYALNAKPQGIDTGAYIGWLHEVVKAQDMQIQQQQIQIDYLYQRLNLVKP